MVGVSEGLLDGVLVGLVEGVDDGVLLGQWFELEDGWVDSTGRRLLGEATECR